MKESDLVRAAQKFARAHVRRLLWETRMEMGSDGEGISIREDAGNSGGDAEEALAGVEFPTAEVRLRFVSLFKSKLGR